VRKTGEGKTGEGKTGKEGSGWIRKRRTQHREQW